MARNRASAKKAGTSFETLIAGAFARWVDDRIERRAKQGALDKGDISGVRHLGKRIVVECKNTSKMSLASWVGEAEVERINDGALAGIVVSKRHGKGKAMDQWVHMTFGDFIALLTGNRDHLEEGIVDGEEE